MTDIEIQCVAELWRGLTILEAEVMGDRPTDKRETVAMMRMLLNLIDGGDR